MKFMAVILGDPAFIDNDETMPPPALMEAMGSFEQEARAAGALLETGGLLSTATGARVTLNGGEIRTIDGPFTEAKEVIGGFATYEVATKEEAVEWTRRFLELHRKHWPEFEGVCEVRQMMEMPG